MMPDDVVALNRRRLPLLDATGGLPSLASPAGPASAQLGLASHHCLDNVYTCVHSDYMHCNAVSLDGTLTHPYHYEYAVSDGTLS
jgi:hypothetical protein